MSESDQRARRNPLSTSLERIGIVAFGGIALAVVLVIAAIFVSARLGKPAQQLQTEILVGASPSRVWEVATALDDYASWNPYMRNVDGFVRPRATITLLLELPGTQSTSPQLSTTSSRTESSGGGANSTLSLAPPRSNTPFVSSLLETDPPVSCRR